MNFDAAFLDRRMAEHKRWQHHVLHELVKEAMGEMAEALQNPAFAKYAQRSLVQALPFPETLHNFPRQEAEPGL